MTKKELNELSKKVIGIAIDVHKTLGPGFTEKIYQQALAYEFTQAGIKFAKEVIIKVKYNSLNLGNQRIDFLIENEIILELKAVNTMVRVHQAQLLSYLKTSDKRLGLLLNFAKSILEIKRVVNKF
jgi:GxxExxY protein